MVVLLDELECISVVIFVVDTLLFWKMMLSGLISFNSGSLF